MSEFQRHFEIFGAGWEIGLNYSPLTHTEPINENGTMEQSPKERWQQKFESKVAVLAGTINDHHTGTGQGTR